MTCNEFESRLDERLHRGLAVSADDLRVHAESCTACCRLFEGAMLLERGVSALKSKPVAGDLAPRLLAAWSAEQSQPAPRPFRLRWQARIGLAAAAAALLFVMLRTTPNTPVADAPGSPTVVADARDSNVDDPQASVDELVRSARSAYLALAQDAAHTLRDAAQVVLPDTSPLEGIPIPTDFNSWKPPLPRLPDVNDAFQWLDTSG